MQYTIIKYPDGTSYVIIPYYGVENKITFKMADFIIK